MDLRALAPAEIGAARRLLTDSGLGEAARVADEKLFGPSPDDERPATYAARAGDVLIGLAARSARWIRLLAVHPGARRRGVGGALLAALERDAGAARVGRLRTLDQPGNYLAPGLTDEATIAWLERRGYRHERVNTNLTIELRGNPKVSRKRAAELAAAAAKQGYAIARAAPGDPAAIALARAFGGAWDFEVARALEGEPAGVHLALRGGQPVAFAAHDGNNRGLGWFGPAGTLPEHRGKGLGEALLIACLVDIAEDHERATIAWVGPREFYDRSAGIAGETRYTVLVKELPP